MASSSLAMVPNCTAWLQAAAWRVPITALDASGGEILHRYPYFLPDGQHFVYAAPNNDPQKSAIYLQSLGSPERRARC